MEIQKTPLPFQQKKRKTKYPFDQFEVGDWVFVKDRLTADRMQNAANAYGRYHGNGYKMSRTTYEGKIYMVRVK